QVTRHQESLLDLQWLEVPDMALEEVEYLSSSMICRLRRVLIEQDHCRKLVVTMTQEWNTSIRPSEDMQHLAVELADTKATLSGVRQELEEKTKQLSDTRHQLYQLVLELQEARHNNMELVASAQATCPPLPELDSLREKARHVKRLEMEAMGLRQKEKDIDFYAVASDQVRTGDDYSVDTKGHLQEHWIWYWIDKLFEREEENVQLKLKLHHLQLDRDTDQKCLEELREENMALKTAQGQSVEESAHLRWELEQLSEGKPVPGASRYSHVFLLNKPASSCFLKLDQEKQSLQGTIQGLPEASLARQESSLQRRELEEENQQLRKQQIEDLRVQMEREKQTSQDLEILSEELVEEREQLLRDIETLKAEKAQEFKDLKKLVHSLRDSSQTSSKARMKGRKTEQKVLLQTVTDTKRKVTMMEWERRQLCRDLEQVKEHVVRAQELEQELHRLQEENEKLAMEVSALTTAPERVHALEWESQDLLLENQRLQTSLDTLQPEGLERDKQSVSAEDLPTAVPYVQVELSSARLGFASPEGPAIFVSKLDLLLAPHCVGGCGNPVENSTLCPQSASLTALIEKNTQLQHQQLAAAHEALQREHACLGALHEHLSGEHEALMDEYSRQKTLLRRTLELESKVLSDRQAPRAPVPPSLWSLMFPLSRCFTVKRSKSTITLSDVELVRLETEGQEGPPGEKGVPTNPSSGKPGVSIGDPAPLGIPTPSSFSLQTKDKEGKSPQLPMFRGMPYRGPQAFFLSKSPILMYLKCINLNFGLLPNQGFVCMQIPDFSGPGSCSGTHSQGEVRCTENSKVGAGRGRDAIKRGSPHLEQRRRELSTFCACELSLLSTSLASVSADARQRLGLPWEQLRLSPEPSTPFSTQIPFLWGCRDVCSYKALIPSHQNEYLLPLGISLTASSAPILCSREAYLGAIHVFPSPSPSALQREAAHPGFEVSLGAHSYRYKDQLQHKAALEQLGTLLTTEREALQQEQRTSAMATEENQRLQGELDRISALFGQDRGPCPKIHARYATKFNCKSCVNFGTSYMSVSDDQCNWLREELQSRDISLTELGNHCQLLSHLKGNLEGENRHLQSQNQRLKEQNKRLLQEDVENKDQHQEQQRQYVEKLNALQRQNETLEEKSMAQRKFHDPAPKKKKHWIGVKALVKLIKLKKGGSRERRKSTSESPPWPLGSSDQASPSTSQPLQSQLEPLQATPCCSKGSEEQDTRRGPKDKGPGDVIPKGVAPPRGSLDCTDASADPATKPRPSELGSRACSSSAITTAPPSSTSTSRHPGRTHGGRVIDRKVSPSSPGLELPRAAPRGSWPGSLESHRHASSDGSPRGLKGKFLRPGWLHRKPKSSEDLMPSRDTALCPASRCQHPRTHYPQPPGVPATQNGPLHQEASRRGVWPSPRPGGSPGSPEQRMVTLEEFLEELDQAPPT
uniref:Coiled-coil domain containing 88B n=1 Tax=Myotis lucifugus TaxID=59463 RepID=G1QA53_MYOLU